MTGHTFKTDDWSTYQNAFSYHDPWRSLEPLEDEIAVIDRVLAELVGRGILPHGDYDHAKMLAFRQFVREQYEVPWTAISPRMQRLIWAINAIHQPRTMVAVGIFCGHTYSCNAGAAVGPGACYEASRLIGIELDPQRADLARRNVTKLDPEGRVTQIVTDHGVTWLRDFGQPVDLLYLDPDGADADGNGLYLPMLDAVYERMPAGALVVAHNSVNWSGPLRGFLKFVRDPRRMRAALNVQFDGEGLQIAAR